MTRVSGRQPRIQHWLDDGWDPPKARPGVRLIALRPTYIEQRMARSARARASGRVDARRQRATDLSADIGAVMRFGNNTRRLPPSSIS